MLQLTNALKFQNTTTIPGSRHIPAVRSREFGAKSYFSGYVFRGDSRPPDVIFEQGFMLQYSVQLIEQMNMMTGTSPFNNLPGFTGKEGISTSVCVCNASLYANNRKASEFRGYVYLIDAMYMGGFAVSDDPETFSKPPILKEINEVCFPCSIPNTSVIGVVWPEGLRPLILDWPEVAVRLNLAVNPEYWSGCEKGLAAAKKVVELFNT
ncbi:scabin-related ADP-ribosyltransferase [Endozoicomonas euniceicola]|uniref:Pierisin-like domain-containing protein n=1 Tax=Endozoicomonas euniceicola TaxID=1234143 RepID=A0ABY6H2G2_9GAMM|nr:hypothetical protein [Endozoicomonas euniceicola]UYM18431.1 hypothetical protein NX720_11185 [Endozoicomonas euniceicola]